MQAGVCPHNVGGGVVLTTTRPTNKQGGYQLTDFLCWSAQCGGVRKGLALAPRQVLHLSHVLLLARFVVDVERKRAEFAAAQVAQQRGRLVEAFEVQT